MAKPKESVWEKNPNRMLIFPPNTHPGITEEYQKDRWILADKYAILAYGFNEEEMKDARSTIRRKR